MTTLDGGAKKKQVEQSAEQHAAVELVPPGPGTGTVADRARRAAQTADQDSAREALAQADGYYAAGRTVSVMSFE